MTHQRLGGRASPRRRQRGLDDDVATPTLLGCLLDPPEQLGLLRVELRLRQHARVEQFRTLLDLFGWTFRRRGRRWLTGVMCGDCRLHRASLVVRRARSPTLSSTTATACVRRPRTPHSRLGNIPVMRFNTHFRSNVIAGVIAFVIYLVIALATGASFGSALLVAVILGLATFAISYIISSLIVAARRR
jgi:hypothetical protein